MADDESKKTDNSNKQVEKAVNTPQKETRKREADIDLLEGSSTGKRAKRVSEESPGRKNAKILLSQQEDGHCPQCGSFASNWSVHCRTNHREFVDYGGDFVVAHRHEVYQFISQCLQKLGASEHHSSVLAKYLTFCDTFGYSSEGLQKLNYYVDMLIADKFSAFGEPQVLEETGYSFKIDCSGILGPLAADFCASKALSFDIGKEPKAVMGIVNAEFSSEFPCVPELMDFCADSLYRSTKNGIIISRNSMTSFVNERKLNARTHKKEDFIGVHNFLSGGVDAKSNTMYFITKGSHKTGRKEPKINNLEDYKNFIEPFITKIIESKVYLDWNKRKHNYEERSRKLGGTKYDLVYFKDVYEKLAALVKTWPIDIEMFEVY